MAVKLILFCLQPMDEISNLSPDRCVEAINSFVFPSSEDIPFRKFQAAKVSEKEVRTRYIVHELIRMETTSGPRLIRVMNSYPSKLLLSEGLLLCYTGSKMKATEIASGIISSLLKESGNISRVVYPDFFLRKLRDEHSLYTTFLRIEASDPLNQIVLKGKDVTESPIYAHFRLSRNSILEIEVKPRGMPREDVLLRVKRTGFISIERLSQDDSIYEEIESRILKLIRTIKRGICPKTTTLKRFMPEVKL